MPGTYQTGWLSAVVYNPVAGTFYPDPNEKAAAPPANTDWCTTVSTESIFNAGRDAIIRGIYLHNSVGGTPSLQIDTFDGVHRLWQSLPNSEFMLLPDWNQFAPGGFRFTTSGIVYATILYEVQDD